MKEKPEFIGRGYDEKDRKENEESLRCWSDEASKPAKGETEKTKEDIEMLAMLNDFIREELDSLGIKNYTPLPPEKIHILSDDVFRNEDPSLSPMGKIVGSFDSLDDALYINKDVSERKKIITEIILHELIHRASTQKFYADENSIFSARTGYNTRSEWKNVRRRRRLLGFNELMNFYTTRKILLKNKKKLKNFGISEKDMDNDSCTYGQFYSILESIAEKISEDKHISKEQVLTDFEKGQFQKNILILKDIGRSFGRGAVKVLSLLGELNESKNNDKLTKMIGRFFAENKRLKRDKMERKILDFFSKNQEKKSG